MANNKEIAQKVLDAVGGAANVTSATHCMTRLRLTLKDAGIPNDDEVNKIAGVLSVVRSGGQYQVVIGQNVPKVYAEFCALTGLAQQEAIDENLDAPKEKLTPKAIGGKVLNYLAGSVTQMIPIMIAAAMFKTIYVILGPDMLKLFTAESDIYRLMDFLYDAGYYFMPIYLGYAAAKTLKANPMLGLYMGGILLAPDLIDIVAAGEPFTVCGIPMRLVNYGSTVLPILLSVWILSYVEKFWKKIMPDALATIFVPFLTMAVMTPLALCALAPIGSFLGDYIGAGLIAFGAHGGFIAVAVIAGLWEFLVMTGMHQVVLISGIMILLSGGTDSCVMVGGGMATMAAFGMALGAFLRIREKDEKALAFGYFVSGFIGGVTEPVLYGIGMKYKRPFIALFVGGFCGGLYAGLTHVTCYVLGATNFLGAFVGYVAGGTANTVNGIIASAISLGATAVLTYMFGFDKNDPAVAKQ